MILVFHTDAAVVDSSLAYSGDIKNDNHDFAKLAQFPSWNLEGWAQNDCIDAQYINWRLENQNQNMFNYV